MSATADGRKTNIDKTMGLILSNTRKKRRQSKEREWYSVKRVTDKLSRIQVQKMKDLKSRGRLPPNPLPRKGRRDSKNNTRKKKKGNYFIKSFIDYGDARVEGVQQHLSFQKDSIFNRVKRRKKTPKLKTPKSKDKTPQEHFNSGTYRTKYTQP